ncbi:hypothetical protein CFOL_v3_06157 [Cephalotus follicularis]|uniref:Uncharacterized protein n=1 Tax=Cephalotus follicularis TaxID=3775 RepID=A0A1Q3B416_CEPFO|nr:hypothetical protein CFOL_v3_06157 [Cephalotus follicularis]
MHEVDNVDLDQYSYLDLLADCWKFMFPKVYIDITTKIGMMISNDRELMDMFASHEHVHEINLFVKHSGRQIDFTLSRMPPAWNEHSDSDVERSVDDDRCGYVEMSDNDDQCGDGIDESDEGQNEVYDCSDEDDAEWMNTEEDNEDSPINGSDYEYELEPWFDEDNEIMD